MPTASANTQSDTSSTQASQTGTLPNLSWRAIPASALPSHPLYTPLPRGLRSPSPSCRLFAQDTPAWSQLHEGRLTTSHIASFLGLFEPSPARRLRIPSSLRGHERVCAAVGHVVGSGGGGRARGEAALARLLQGEEEAGGERSGGGRGGGIGGGGADDGGSLGGSSICGSSFGGSDTFGSDSSSGNAGSTGDPMGSSGAHPGSGISHARHPVALAGRVPPAELASALLDALPGHQPPGSPTWAPSTSPAHRFTYCGGEAAAASAGRRCSSGSEARQQWGRHQEATALVVALDALLSDASPSSARARVWETGLCSLEGLPLPAGSPPHAALPLIGASPDGLLLRADGSVEVVEVKAVCPFVGAGSRLAASDAGPGASLPAWHIPQLALEIACCGPHCTGANVIITSARAGARVWWLPRDDAYIAALLTLVAAVQARFVEAGPGGKRRPPPPRDFPLALPGYSLFLQQTLALAAGALLRADVPQERVQRAPPEAAPLFLDGRGGCATQEEGEGRRRRRRSRSASGSSCLEGGEEKEE